MHARSAPMLVAAALAALPACRRTPPAQAPARPVADDGPQPAKIVVTKARTDLVFTYLDAQGAYHDATSVDEVPEASRAQVLVRDLSRTPEELRSADFLYVADLREGDKDGRYACGAVSRRAFERKGAAEAAAQAARLEAEAGGAVVVVYTASWCGVCRQAREYLKRRGVPFLDRDVEKEDGAQTELQAKLKAKGLRFTGVPVIDVAGELMTGFDADALSGLLEKKGLARTL